MRNALITIVFVAACSFSTAFAESSNTDWPWWRGPTHNGIASPNQSPPTKWDQQSNVLWKTPIPGRGHASPIIVGDNIYIPTADEKTQTQSVLCINKNTGRIRWKSDIHQGDFNTEKQKRATWASASLACDGQRLFINFFNRDAIYTYALNFKGEILWETKIADFLSHQGFGSSPLIYKTMVIVTADSKIETGGKIAALDRKTGKTVWSIKRPALPNYPSPVVFHLDNKDQLIVTGCDLISSFDPNTGSTLWEYEGATTECVVTAVTDGTRIFTGGGYPKNHTMAMRADGTGKVDWENNQRIYVPSMIAKDNHLYAVADKGVAFCWDSATGKELWKNRLGAEFFASPTMVNDLIYATNIQGVTYVFKATPTEFKLISQNKLGDESYASPIIADSKIYLRAVYSSDDRQEFLYCIGQK